jgi:hypothetical protein
VALIQFRTVLLSVQRNRLSILRLIELLTNLVNLEPKRAAFNSSFGTEIVFLGASLLLALI